MIATIAPAAAETPFSLLYSLISPITNGNSAHWGANVAVDTNFAVVTGRYFENSPGCDRVTVYNPTNGASLYTMANPGQHSSFGSSVAVSGSKVFVADFDSHPGNGEGCVYVYDLSWIKPTAPVLRVSLWARIDSVAASGNYLAIRSYFYTYVYDLSSAAPTSPVLTIASEPSFSDRRGVALAISGTRLVVGSGEYSLNTNAGSAYVYDLTSSTPSIPVFTLQSPAPATRDFFGGSVAISGNRVVVGMDRGGTNVPGTLGGAAYVYDLASATPSSPVATLTSPNSSWGDYFGYSVGISGTRVVVGAFYDDTGASNSDSAYVYDLSGATPAIPVVTLNNPTPATQDQFGQAVAIAGGRVVIGAPEHDMVTTNAGSAYLYDVAAVQPALPIARLDPGPAPGFAGLGQSVAISGTRVVAAAPGEASACVYDLGSATPTVPIATLRNPSVNNFGSSVAISGSRAVVAAYTGRTPPGSVYVYELTSDPPTAPTATIVSPSSAGLSFGYSVAISGTRVAVSAPDPGRAYVYDLSTPTEPPLELNNPGTAPGFGCAVAISGTRVVVGAFYWGQTNGAAYVYDLTTRPVSMITLSNSSPAPGEVLGFSVAMSGARVVVGTGPYPWDGYAPGKVYVYNLESDTPAMPVTTLLNPNPHPYYSAFGYSVAVSGTRIVASSLHREYENAWGRTYAYNLDSDTPTAPIATFSNPMFAKDDHFGCSVAVGGETVVVGSIWPPVSGAAFVFGPSPRLTIAPASSNSATISWAPTNSPEFFLQSATDLRSSNWVYAPSHTTNPVSISVSNQARFYRLFSP